MTEHRARDRNRDRSSRVTRLLRRWSAGDEQAMNAVYPLVYEDLRALAAAYLARERGDHTLQPTALVHEAYLRLAASDELDLQGRTHFFAIAARALRRILVDHARKQVADRRVGAHRKEPLRDDLVAAPRRPYDVLDVHRVLEHLESRHPRIARLVELRFFGGLSEAEAAEVLDVSRSTLTRDWRFARLWLKDRLSRDVAG